MNLAILIPAMYLRTATAYVGDGEHRSDWSFHTNWSTVLILPLVVTWYHAGLGACGYFNRSSDHIVALSPFEYRNGRSCLRNITIRCRYSVTCLEKILSLPLTDNGKTVDASAVDLCPECASGSIDLSTSAFTALAPLDAGRLHGVVWNFN